MGMPQEADSFEFAGYLGVLRRRWWVVLVLACLGILAAGAYIVESPKTYTAVATVNVTATGINQSQGGAVAGGRTSNAVNLDTESQIVKFDHGGDYRGPDPALPAHSHGPAGKCVCRGSRELLDTAGQLPG